MSDDKSSAAGTSNKGSGLNRSKSWERQREKLPRKVKSVQSYKETRTYNKSPQPADFQGLDFRKRSSLTPRSPISARKEAPKENSETESEASESTFIENLVRRDQSSPARPITFLANLPFFYQNWRDQSSPISGESSNNSDSELEEDFLSTELDKSNPTNLKTPLKTECTSHNWDLHKNSNVLDENKVQLNLFSEENQTSDIAASLGLKLPETTRNSENQSNIDSTISADQNPRDPETPTPNAVVTVPETTGFAEVRKSNNEILAEIVEQIEKEQNSNSNEDEYSAIMADMWLKMAKQVPELSSRDSADKLYESIDKLRQYGKIVPHEQTDLFFKQISGKMDSEMRKYMLKETTIKTVDQLCDFLEEKFVSKGSYLKNFAELQNIKKRRGENFTDFGKRILKMKELVDKQYLFRHRNESDIRNSQDLEVIALNSFLKYVRTCPALLISIGTPDNIQTAVDAIEKVEPDMDIAEIDDDKNKPSNVQINTLSGKITACQKCGNEGHEAFYCPLTNCIYCLSSMHKSAECMDVPTELKINIVCKECRGSNHTIDTCSHENNGGFYCQYCQAANSHKANTCEMAVNFSRQNELNNKMKSLSMVDHERGMDKARWASRSAIQGGSADKPCYICGDIRHLARQCPKSQQTQTFPRGLGRGGGFNSYRGRGNFNNNFNQNQGQYQNYNRNSRGFNSRTFSRGSQNNRGYFRGIGYPRQQGFPNFPGYYNPNFFMPPLYGYAMPATPQQNPGPSTFQQNIGPPAPNPTITMVEKDSEN